MRNKFYRLHRFKRRLISFPGKTLEDFLTTASGAGSGAVKALRIRESFAGTPHLSTGHRRELEDYELRGFIDAAQRSAVPFDITVADMHLGYYITRTAIQRLREDVIVPARANGYKRISLAGISLGGFGALYYALHHPADVARLFLLAPYLGDERVIGEISRAGGAKDWNPDSITEHDEPHKLWQSLKRLANEASGLGLANFYLAYGLQDNFAAGNNLLAELLPAGHVYTVHGKHDWRTWSSLWNMLLAQSKDIFS